jgi:multiple sugar transport system ATP-binding protein
MASVTYEHVSKMFGDVVAVKDISIEIPDKEFLVFVGPSGCGKTTSLRLLAGLEEPTEGDIYIGDRRVNDVAPKDRDIAMVFQSYALYPHMSVYDNMAFGLRLRKTPRDEIDRRVHEAASDLGIDELLDRKPRQLSGGQRQRVAVGRAIVRDPAAFLMDEPLSNLDAKLRVEARAMLSRLHQRLETTFIYVTHDQTEAMTMGSRIAVLRDGVLQQIDTPQALYDTPTNVFVAGFIGSPSMNFFDATLVGDASEMYVQSGGFKLRVPDDKAKIFAEQGYGGREIVLGIRPNDVYDPGFVAADIMAQPVQSKVDVLEMMGNEIFLYLLTRDGKEFVARVDPRSGARVGDEMAAAFDMNRMHVFDPQTEAAIR